MPNDRTEINAGTGRAAALTEQEFAQRFEACGRLLWTVAAGVLGDASEADDVLQEAGMMAFTKLDQYQPGTNFQAWMASFVRNVALNQGRKRQRRKPQALEPEVLQGPRGLPPMEQGDALPVDDRGRLLAEQNAFDDSVLAGLRSLSSAQRSCLLLRSVMDLSYREIAETLGMPEGTAMSHVHRGRALMRASLLDMGPSGSLGEEVM